MVAKSKRKKMRMTRCKVKRLIKIPMRLVNSNLNNKKKRRRLSPSHIKA